MKVRARGNPFSWGSQAEEIELAMSLKGSSLHLQIRHEDLVHLFPTSNSAALFRNKAGCSAEMTLSPRTKVAITGEFKLGYRS